MLESKRVPAQRLVRLGLAILGLFCGIQSAPAQLTITSPFSNQVMQRNMFGAATVSVTAYTQFPYAQVTAALIPLEGNANSPQEQQVDAFQLGQGFIHISFNAYTGWYRLKLTATAANGIADSAEVARVGVGEVFLIAGNSNAMGLPGLGAKDPSPNVISFNSWNKFLNTENITVAPTGPMPAPVFEPLKSANHIFPNGETAWYWGELGDMLFQRWGTPILFFNAAWAAANSENYRDAASGKDAYNLYVGKFWPNRQPYSNIVNTMRYMTSMTGVRAVLWSHGENDAQLGVNEEQYFENIRTLITNSRAEAGYFLPWFIARNSASNQQLEPYQPIINAQNRLIFLPDFNTFAGPDLDTIQIPRPASAHFENVPGGTQGLTHAALAWNRTLTDQEIGRVTPMQPAYTLHTGVTPSGAFPGAAFGIPFATTGNAPFGFQIQVELLDAHGQYLATVGTGNLSPVTVLLPDTLKSGDYRIRLTGQNPTVPGSISMPIHVTQSTRDIAYVNAISARPVGNDILVSWAMAPVPGLTAITVQSTTDGLNYEDLETFQVTGADASVVYGYTDPQPESNTIFYRLKLAYSNGTSAFTTIVTVFRNGAPDPWTVFPNPVTRQQFYITPVSEPAMTCRLFDAAGREHPITVSTREAVGLISVRPQYPLPAGKYILQMQAGETQQTRHIVFY